MSAYAPIDDSVNHSSGNTVAVLAIDMSAKDFNNETSNGAFILLTGIVSMILAAGGIFFFGIKKSQRR